MGLGACAGSLVRLTPCGPRSLSVRLQGSWPSELGSRWMASQDPAQESGSVTSLETINQRLPICKQRGFRLPATPHKHYITNLKNCV